MPFVAEHVTRTHLIQLSAMPDVAFRLFEPIGETLWASDFRPEMVYPPSGVTETGATFTTQDQEGVRTLWIIITYDPSQFWISYLRITPDSNVAWIDIRCDATKNKTTQAQITYTFTALSEKGNDYIRNMTEEHYRQWIGSWESAINYYLRHGQALTHH